MAYIYVIKNKINGKQYVGKTSASIEERFSRHIKDINKRATEKRPLYSAMKKYGIENFEVKELEECSIQESSEREKYWIEELDTYHSGYNATLGGDGKNIYDYSKLANEYLKYKNIQLICQKYGCDKHVVHTACKHENVPILSSQEVIKNQYGKKVQQCNKNNHEIVYNTFDSLMTAATYAIENKITNCKHSTIRTHISEVCRGKRKSAAGYYWKFC